MKSAAGNSDSITNSGMGVKGIMNLSCQAWTTLNSLRTGHGRCGNMMNKWGLRDSPACNPGMANGPYSILWQSVIGEGSNKESN